MAGIYPDSFQEIVALAVDRHGDDIDKAVEAAEYGIRNLDDFDEWIDKLVTSAVRGLVNDKRHSLNTATRKANGEYGGPAKVGVGSAVNDAAKRSFLASYFIGGRTLGSITGKELPLISGGERERAHGCMLNAALCDALAKVCKDDKRVDQCFTDVKAREIFDSLQKKQLKVAGRAIADASPKNCTPSQQSSGRANKSMKSTATLPDRKTQPAQKAMAGN
jgi:hypothetical protein